jgi:hypothetical protein
MNIARLLDGLPGLAKAVVMAAVLGLTACASGSQPQSGTAIEGLAACPEPRPEVCTMEYRVVCAQRQDGSSGNFSNACSACADPTVAGYREGSCPVTN